jgi:AraC-like DNA-binding protein
LRIKNILKSREHLRNIFQKNLKLEPSAVSITSSADDKFLRKLLEQIEAGIPESEYSVDTLEKEMGISHTHFYRKVKSLTGFSGKELLQNMRLKRAADLLLQNKLRVSEIAYMIGFNNPKYFSKCFKEKYGVNPSEYIDNQKEISS